MQPAPPSRRARHWARRTHRVLGVSSLLFLVFISVSGIVLNHAEELGLSRSSAGTWILDIYDVPLPPAESAYQAGDVLFAISSGTLYANGEELSRVAGQLVGAVASTGSIVVASADQLFVTMGDGALLERFSPGRSSPMTKLGLDGERVIVATQDDYFEFDPENMSLSTSSAVDADAVTWSLPVSLNARQAEDIGMAALGLAINWERVLLDVHSGRILPSVGRYIADVTALCLLYMCVSGFVLWTRRR